MEGGPQLNFKLRDKVLSVTTTFPLITGPLGPHERM